MYSTYLLLFHRVIRPVNARQCLRVPAEFVVARVCVYDGGAVVAAGYGGGALLVGLSEGEGC